MVRVMMEMKLSKKCFHSCGTHLSQAIQVLASLDYKMGFDPTVEVDSRKVSRVCGRRRRLSVHECFRTQSYMETIRNIACSYSLLEVDMIRKLKSGEYRLYSRKKDPKTGKRRNLGTFETREAAEKHEREVQYFKRH